MFENNQLNSSMNESAFKSIDDQSEIKSQVSTTDFDFDKIILNASSKSTATASYYTQLTAETIRILSEINVDNLSFESKLDLLFNDLGMLKASAVQGCLADTNLRCLAWMIFLECIPIDKSKWVESIKLNRFKYEKLKNDYYCDPRNQQNACQSDHPLSQSGESNWHKYFKQNELKTVIVQDVMRINHHSEYFTYQTTKNLIISLLFMYIQYEKTDYKQGMHEILTCIIYVLHEEYTNLARINESNEIIKYIANLEYLEHDAFIMFRALMARIHDWFGTKTKSQEDKHTLNTLNPKLFSDNQEFYESAIIKKIEYITNVILRNNDIEVFNYLNEIEVTLHPFGIRWLRLLFLRELEFPFSLVLWDAVFATDNQEFSLVNYIFVALLCCLRDEIFKMDNSSCMKFLMQPHFNLDPNDVLKTALYLQNPAIYVRPNIWSMDQSYEIVPKTYTPLNKSSSTYSIGVQSNSKTPHNKERNTLANQKINPAFSENDFTKLAHKLEYDHLSPQHKASNNNSHHHHHHHNHNNKKNKILNNEMKLINMEHTQHNVDLVKSAFINKIADLQEENENLKSKVDELVELCTLSSTKMHANLSLLQEEIAKTYLNNDESILLALAGLKKVRDQLNPIFDENRVVSVSTSPKQNNNNLNDKSTQTTSELDSLSSSSIDLTAESIVNGGRSIKNRILSKFKTNSTSEETTNTNQEVNDSITRIRSLSLKSIQLTSSLLPSVLTFNTNKISSKNSLDLNNDDNYANLDDMDSADFTKANMKLVLHDNELTKDN